MASDSQMRELTHICYNFCGPYEKSLSRTFFYDRSPKYEHISSMTYMECYGREEE